jgi:hypothetical protein
MEDPYRSAAPGGDRLRAALALQLVAAATGVPADRLKHRVRLHGQACRARWVAMYLSHVTFGWPFERIGLAFDMNRATAAQACRWAEDERDRPWLDDLLNRLERSMRDILDTPRCELPA